MILALEGFYVLGVHPLHANSSKAVDGAGGSNLPSQGLRVPCWIHQGSQELAARASKCCNPCWMFPKEKQKGWESCSTQLYFSSAPTFLGLNIDPTLSNLWLNTQISKGVHRVLNLLCFVRYAYKPSGPISSTPSAKISAAWFWCVCFGEGICVGQLPEPTGVVGVAWGHHCWACGATDEQTCSWWCPTNLSLSGFSLNQVLS